MTAASYTIKNVSLHNSPGRGAVCKTLAYFDIFNYPLTAAEIQQFSGMSITAAIVQECLQQLLDEGIVFFHHGFYSLQNNNLLAIRRREGNQRAAQLLQKAGRIGKFLYHFPFVRAIGISGSLSKNFADEKADIDFFIITKASRLWIARTFMHLYKKMTYLAGRQHYYCMNYYVDEEALLLQDRNVYTAIELKTLLPVSGEKTMQQFFNLNNWVNHWLPQCTFREQDKADKKESLLKRFIEYCLDHRVGNLLDNYLQRITARRWKKKEAKGKRNLNGLLMGLTTDKHFAYSNSGSLREKVLSLYEKKLAELGIRE